MLADLVKVNHLAHPDPDLGGAFEPALGDRFHDRSQLELGRGKQVLALAPAFFCQTNVLADHQSLSRIGRIGDLGQVLLVEERKLQVAAQDQGLNLGAAQARDPGQTLDLPQRLDAGRCQHAAVAHQDQLAELEVPLAFRSSHRSGLRLAGRGSPV